jgi:hypothetical protein
MATPSAIVSGGLGSWSSAAELLLLGLGPAVTPTPSEGDLGEILTVGLGPWGSVNFVITLGLGVAAAPDPEFDGRPVPCRWKNPVRDLVWRA